RERYPVRIRYLRELRDSIESLEKIMVPAANGSQIPLIQLAKINYLRGPEMIKSEDTFLVGYVLFDMKAGLAEVEVVEQAKHYLSQKIESGEFQLSAGVSYSFAGSYENQLRAQKTLSIILPLTLFLIFMILYFQFKTIPVTSLVFSGIAVAWAGGFIMLWFYSQSWFLDFSILGINLRELFQIRPYNLSVAVWVGFLALFGIATDDGVLIATYLMQSFEKSNPDSVEEIRQAVLLAGQRRVRPALMTTATTILALIPVLTASGRGAEIMIPMSIPSFGGMVIALITMLVVPVLYSTMKEYRLKSRQLS
ncbi:MAG: efflux RND transporter permease subunit, partial [Bacteroidales bacterium]|nr:efflux RND transporter permease subunit [Bacteroidales bacterium]